MLFINAVIITIMTVINQTTVWSRHRIITYVYVTATMMIILMTLVMLIYQQRKHRKRNIKGMLRPIFYIDVNTHSDRK